MTTSDWLNVAAIVLAPIFALQISRWLEHRREERQRRLHVFRTLMATRARRLSAEHVSALNIIDVEFSGGDKQSRSVSDAWKAYLDSLGDAQKTPQREDLFVNLLSAMATQLGYDYDKVHLYRAAYAPVGHGNVERDQASVLSGMAAIMEGKAALPIIAVDPGPVVMPSPAEAGRKRLNPGSSDSSP